MPSLPKQETDGSGQNNLYIAPNSTFTNPMVLQPGLNGPYKINLLGSGSSSNTAATVWIEYTYTVNGEVYSQQESFYYNGTNPCTGACPPPLPV